LIICRLKHLHDVQLVEHEIAVGVAGARCRHVLIPGDCAEVGSGKDIDITIAVQVTRKQLIRQQ
jgi:hypothetical protein